tara:strand:+ start:3284 stop:3403 length:120 start_codon:yes stop_codon:yes gene_type:complete
MFSSKITKLGLIKTMEVWLFFILMNLQPVNEKLIFFQDF